MRDEPTLRVMVVDDHEGTRIGVSKLVDAWQPHMQIVGTAASAGEAIALARQVLPDVVVLDACLGPDDGLALIEPLTRGCLCRVIVLSASSDPMLARRALRLGAEGAIHKAQPGRALWAAILGVADDDEHDDAASPVHPFNAGGEMSLPRGSK